ncbi:DNA cytosine methyltransferase [Bacteroides salyersiae]|uniref:DNA cytosine methyltransferase n=1 Tax=Bacteroides salyersiae TaxID=291644 RepID=UPI0030B9D460
MQVKRSRQVEGDNSDLKDTETGLWWHMYRAIYEIRPRWVVAENVANITRVNNGRDFAKILHSLSGLGYNAEWKIMYASDAGAPQRRARCYLVAYSDSIRLQEGESFFSNVCKAIIKERRMFAGTSLSVGISWVSQPSVCSVDYGFSNRSSELYGKSRLKEEVFHAYGNSMCPQLVHKIFKRIEEIERLG